MYNYRTVIKNKMQEIRDINELDLPVEEKYDRIISILPELRDNYRFKYEYTNSDSLDLAICYTNFAEEYLTIYDLEYLIELAVLHNCYVTYEVIYRKSEDKIATYNLLNDKLYDRAFLYYGFIHEAIRENNREVYTEIITRGNVGSPAFPMVDDEDDLEPIYNDDVLSDVIYTACESNNKEFVRWFIEYTGYGVNKVLFNCISNDIETNVFIIKILAEDSSVDEIVEYRPRPSASVFKSFMLAGASREVLYEVYGDLWEFQGWIRIEDI